MYKYKKYEKIVMFLMILLLVGCSKSQNTENLEETNEIKETVVEKIETTSDTYSMTQRTLTTSLDGIQRYSIQDEKILAVGYVTDMENRVISYYLTSWEENWRDEWTEQKKIELPFTTSSYRLQCQGLDMDMEGNTYIILTDNSENHIYFIKINSDGEIVLNCDLIMILPEKVTISGMSVGEDDKVYLEDSQENVVYGLDIQGNFISEYKLEEGHLWSLSKKNDGSVYLVTEKKNQLYVNTPIESDEILFQNQEEGISVNQYMDVYEGLENHFFVTTTKGLFGYQLGEETITQILDWSLSGIDYNAIDYVGVMEKEEEQVITIISEGKLQSDEVEVFTFVKTDDSEKQYLVLATLDASSELTKQIVAYNKLHPEYPIQTKIYTNNEDGLRQLNTDLLAGNMIDIIDMDSIKQLTSIDYYAEQGLLEDIGKLLEKDETIDETDLLQSILDANKVDGVLYNFVPSFTIETFAGAKSMVGDDFVWTVEEALNLVQRYPDSSMYACQSKQQFLYDICRYNGKYLVNEDEGECYFNSKSFIQLLSYTNTLSESEDVEKFIGSERNMVYQQQCLLDKQIEFEVWLKGYRRAKGLFAQGKAQDDFSLVGFPSINEQDTNGSVFTNIISISIASTSQKKEIAWGFVQYLLSDSYQSDERLKKIGYPVRKSIIQNIMEAQLTDENNAFSGFGSVKFAWDIRYGYATQDDIDTMNSFLNSINRLAWENDTIYNIVWEEAQYYFAGECTAEEAAQAMQSRVELYLMEKE